MFTEGEKRKGNGNRRDAGNPWLPFPFPGDIIKNSYAKAKMKRSICTGGQREDDSWAGRSSAQAGREGSFGAGETRAYRIRVRSESIGSKFSRPVHVTDKMRIVTGGTA